MIAILPMLLESFAIGSVAVVAGMAVWHLFKHEKSTTGLAQKKNNLTQEEVSTTTSQKQDFPEPVAERVAQETAAVTKTTPVVMESSREETVDEEPMLKRHHLHTIRLMLEATTFPRPTDSMLSRHYDEMIDAKSEDCLLDETKMTRLVADYDAYLNAQSSAEVAESSMENFDDRSMLRRHHLHTIRMMLEATTFPRPTDSALSRHYDEMIDAKADDCLECETKMARLLADYEDYEKSQSVTECAAIKAGASELKPCIVPEDSMLKRHFLTNLRANIEKNKAARPTDSALRRHFDAMINAEMENYLSCH